MQTGKHSRKQNFWNIVSARVPLWRGLLHVHLSPTSYHVVKKKRFNNNRMKAMFR